MLEWVDCPTIKETPTSANLRHRPLDPVLFSPWHSALTCFSISERRGRLPAAATEAGLILLTGVLSTNPVISERREVQKAYVGIRYAANAVRKLILIVPFSSARRSSSGQLLLISSCLLICYPLPLDAISFPIRLKCNPQTCSMSFVLLLEKAAKHGGLSNVEHISSMACRYLMSLPKVPK